MGATSWVAWIGACTGIASLAWNIFVKVTSGARLVVTAIPNTVFIPPPPGNPKFVSVTVTNIGTATTTLTNLSLHIYDSRWKQKRQKALSTYVVTSYQGPQLPQKLEVGAQWQALIRQDPDLAKLLNSQKLWCGVWHTFSKTPAEIKISHPEPVAKNKVKEARAREKLEN